MSKPIIVRLLTLGDSGGGKSAILMRYTQHEFYSENIPTIGIDFRLKTVEFEGQTVKVQVWDTAGQERFRTITHNYYRGAHGIVLIYDISQPESFENVRKWIADVKTHADPSVNMVLIGNKVDLEDQRAVDREVAKNLADEFSIEFYETSAKNDINISDAFNSLVKQVVVRLNGTNNKLATDGNVDVMSQHFPKTKKKCC